MLWLGSLQLTEHKSCRPVLLLFLLNVHTQDPASILCPTRALAGEGGTHTEGLYGLGDPPQPWRCRPGPSGHWTDAVLPDWGEGTKRSAHIPMPHPRAAVASEGSGHSLTVLDFRTASAQVVRTHTALRKPFSPRDSVQLFSEWIVQSLLTVLFCLNWSL